MSIIQAHISDKDEEIITQYAKAKNISISDLIREAVMKKIEMEKTEMEKTEDEIDLELYGEAIAEFEKNPVTYTLDEAAKELGLDIEL